ncbi:hypothetical protein G6045_36990 [Streptomyces sp. YC504]|uniref:Uncharacterized protein n=1 Tax=Streptomyces mesophilus TaxID=1775132 RepID=A0A6G4XWS4_9ACTN|nr:hypothetical protein [Streptomyces mesophilus]NGO81220.1 hypothetical protein [Streptomyces mesophilus]
MLPALDELITAASSAEVDADGQAAALAAFRAARDSGAHRQGARTRRRDDWRPRTHARIAWRAVLGTLIAGLTVGGVAVAVSGGPGSGPDVDSSAPAATPAVPQREPESERDRAGTPDDLPEPGKERSARPSRPGDVRHEEALCRSLDKVGGKALDSAARQRLTEAAGPQGDVRAYCARLLAEAERAGTAGRGASTKEPDGQGAPTKEPDGQGAASTKEPDGQGAASTKEPEEQGAFTKQSDGQGAFTKQSDGQGASSQNDPLADR